MSFKSYTQDQKLINMFLFVYVKYINSLCFNLKFKCFNRAKRRFHSAVNILFGALYLGHTSLKS